MWWQSRLNDYVGLVCHRRGRYERAVRRPTVPRWGCVGIVSLGKDSLSKPSDTRRGQGTGAKIDETDTTTAVV